MDLEKPLPDELINKFDVVFNHTTLEHVFDINLAFENLCKLSSDIVVLVVPVIQNIHVTRTYGDYWRLTTLGIAKMFKKFGFKILVMGSNDQPFAPVYCFVIATKNPEKYKGIIKENVNFEMGGQLFGSSLKKDIIDMMKDLKY